MLKLSLPSVSAETSQFTLETGLLVFVGEPETRTSVQ